jgi:hypothetical protein
MEQLLEGLEYDTSSEIRDRYSRDASIFQVTPAAVVYPRSVGELSELESMSAVLWVKIFRSLHVMPEPACRAAL